MVRFSVVSYTTMVRLLSFSLGWVRVPVYVNQGWSELRSVLLLWFALQLYGLSHRTRRVEGCGRVWRVPEGCGGVPYRRAVSHRRDPLSPPAGERDQLHSTAHQLH